MPMRQANQNRCNSKHQTFMNKKYFLFDIACLLGSLHLIIIMLFFNVFRIVDTNWTCPLFVSFSNQCKERRHWAHCFRPASLFMSSLCPFLFGSESLTSWHEKRHVRFPIDSNAHEVYLSTDVYSLFHLSFLRQVSVCPSYNLQYWHSSVFLGIFFITIYCFSKDHLHF